MASTVEGAPAGMTAKCDGDLPLWRLNVLRAMFLVFAVGGLFVHPQWMINPSPTARGMIDGMLAGLWVMSFFGLRYPLRLLPIFLFEFVWKTIWLLWFGIPQWLAGGGSPRLGEDIILIGLGPVLFGLVIPWGYVWRHYVRATPERWC